MCPCYGSFRPVTYERVHTDIGGERGGRGKKGYIYIKNLQGWPPPVCGCCFYETTCAAFICSCILYMHLSVHAYIHIQVYSLMRAHTHTRARIRARMHLHMHMTHTSARAQTRMHPGMSGPDHARTLAPAHEHACMRTHMCKHTRTCVHTHAHALTCFGCALTDWAHTPQL